MTTLNNEQEIRNKFLHANSRAWRVLFLYESDRLELGEAADLVGVSGDDFKWIRAVALDMAKPAARKGAK